MNESSNKSKQYIYNLSLAGYFFIGVGCNGFYQRNLDLNIFSFSFWIFFAFLGGIILTIKAIYSYKIYQKTQLFTDLCFVIPLIIFFSLHIRPELLYTFVFIYIFTYIYIYSKRFHNNH